jgi:hypothetical protein
MTDDGLIVWLHEQITQLNNSLDELARRKVDLVLSVRTTKLPGESVARWEVVLERAAKVLHEPVIARI